MTIQKLAGAILVGVPLLAHGQTAPDDLQAMTNRQIELEKQVREQDARIRELERLLKERLGTDGAGAAPAVPAAQQSLRLPQSNKSRLLRSATGNADTRPGTG